MSTTKHRLIAFTGAMGAGKSTAADAYPEAARVSFAEPIRRMLIALGVSEQNLRNPNLKNAELPQFGGLSARYLMQTLGTEWGRKLICDTIWIDAASRIIVERLKTADVVIDDCRFDNEADAVHALGGVVIDVMRPGCGASASHQSEYGVSIHKIDYCVLNQRTPQFLHEWVMGRVDEHFAKSSP